VLLYPNAAQILHVLTLVVGLQNLQLMTGFKLVALSATLIPFLQAAPSDLAPGIASILPTAVVPINLFVQPTGTVTFSQLSASHFHHYQEAKAAALTQELGC